MFGWEIGSGWHQHKWSRQETEGRYDVAVSGWMSHFTVYRSRLGTSTAVLLEIASLVFFFNCEHVFY